MVKAASANITQSTEDFSALLDILRTDDTGEGLRAEEISEQWGVSIETTRKRLRKALAIGVVRLSSTGRKHRRIDGIPITVPAYVMEPRQ